MNKCKYCDTERDDWEYKAVHYNFGDLGKYELSVAVSDKGMLIELGKELEDAGIPSARFKIHYCPWCGRKLNEVKK